MSGEAYSGSAVRRAAWDFLSGKAVSALLTFAIMLWVVRLLPVAEYGAYVVLAAGAELGFALAALGLPWLAARYLPDYRLHANGSAIERFCRRLALWQATALMALAVLVAVALDLYLNWAGLSGHRVAAWLALGMLVTEGFARFLREGLMAPLLLQRQARTSLILRQLFFVVAIGAISFIGHAKATWVLAAELSASVLGWLAAGIGLVRYLQAISAQVAKPGWLEPTMGDQWRIAMQMYAAHVISLAYSPQVFLNIVQRALGSESAALFGFLRTLNEQIARYLPATLLFAVLRPKLIASHLQDGVVALAGNANLAGKLSLFVLLPVVVLAALSGEILVALLSGWKFENSGFYLLGFLVTLVPFSQRQLIETVAVAFGRAGLCTLGSIFGLAVFPLLLFLLSRGVELWALLLAMLFGQLAFNTVVLAGLSPIGYEPDWRGAGKLAASAFLALLAGSGILFVEAGAFWIILNCLIAILVFFGVAWWLSAFTVQERQRLDQVLGRRLFQR